MGEKAKYFAVLMGDLVDSEKSVSTAELHARFNHAVTQHNILYSDSLASPLTITLGDEFQGLTTSLVAAARLARDMRMDLTAGSIDCRMAVGLVQLQTPVNRERAWNMMGPGLATTRAKLNDKRSTNRYRFDILGQPLLEIMLEACGATLAAIEQDWTVTQRADIQALLRGATPSEVAKQRNVSAHNIYKVRTSGRFDLYMTQWHAVNEVLAKLDEMFGLERSPQ